jgi:hypothetical protein
VFILEAFRIEVFIVEAFNKDTFIREAFNTDTFPIFEIKKLVFVV